MSTKIFFFIIPFLYPYYSFGQSTILENDSTKNKLEEVIITGTKTERVLSSLPLNASIIKKEEIEKTNATSCLLYTSPSPRDVEESRMPSSA